MDLGIKDRVALVTGASAGLGFAAARALALDGAKVAIVSRSAENLVRASEALREATGAAVPAFPADLTDIGGIPLLVRSVRERLGPISILVANAGGPPAGTFEELSPEQFDRAYRLTLLSSVELCREVLPDMKAAAWGRIVAITSVSVKQPIDGLLLSNVFRAGLTGFLKTLSREVAAQGITVNSVAPGYTDTERLVELAQGISRSTGRPIEEIRQGWAAANPMKRLGRPEEIAAAIAFLCSEPAGYITGSVLTVDGGRVAGLL